MFFPVRSERRLRRFPWVTVLLIAANGLFFMLSMGALQRAQAAFSQVQQVGLGTLDDLMAAHPIVQAYLWPEHAQIHQYISYAFLHAGWLHLGGNMLFLWVFGTAVEDRLGRAAYLFFYLAMGVAAGLGHALLESQPVLGASGAVAGVTGLYLVLFPLARVRIVYWLIVVVGSVEVTGLVLIASRVALDALMQMVGHQGVAYIAHLTGYGAGFLVGLFLLGTRLLPREPYDLLSLLERGHRGRRFRQRARAELGVAGPPSASAQLANLLEAADRYDLPRTAALYRALRREQPGIEAALPEAVQLEIANYLMADAQYDEAAHAYDALLMHHPGSAHRAHVQLLLGLLSARYLGQAARAAELLAEASPHLSGDDQVLAREVMAELEL